MKQIRQRLTYANVMSSIAVFFILGGATAFAATKIGANELKANSVLTGKIKKEAVTEGKIKNGAITTGKLANGAVTTDKIANGAVTTDKIANDSVTGDKVKESTLSQVPSAATAAKASAVSPGAVTPAGLSQIPVVRVFNSVSQTLPNNADVTLDFDTESFDVGDLHSTTTDPSRLTASVSGIYRVSASIGFTSNSGRDRVEFVKNGTITLFNTQNPSTGDNTFVNPTDLVQLNAGDFIQVVAQQNSGVSSQAFSCSPAGACPSFSMEWVAPS